ncbi:MAG: DUF4397 domain-containing protein [Candidatus Latescibacterota bacterium]|nr:MAG: DUF4397 domain-containing protein [Candidatus Latescibacterota bacterium]
MVVLIVFAAGCSDDDDTIMQPPVDMGKGAQVRVIHGSPDAPAVDIYAEVVATSQIETHAPGDEVLLIQDLAYGETSAYIEVAAGTYNIKIRGAGADPSSPAVFETGGLAIPDDVKITTLAAGLLGAAPGSTEAFRVAPLVEDFDPAGAGNAIVRIFNASADAPAVAIDVGNDGVPEITDLDPFDETGAMGVELPAGVELQIAIWAGSPLERVTVFTTPSLPAGAELFVIATGLLAKLPREVDGFALLAVGPTGSIGFIRQNPVVFALHGSPDAPAVDIFAGAGELVDNLSFGELSGAIQVPPGSYDLTFRVHDNGPEAATVTTPGLVAGERYLALASGFVGGQPSFTLLANVDGFSVDPAGAFVRVVHGSPDAPAVDVGTVDAGGVLTPISAFTNLAFGDASVSSGTSTPIGALRIGVSATGSTTPVATFDIATVAGLRAFAVAAGSLQGTGESFRLIIVNTSVFPWAAAEVPPN